MEETEAEPDENSFTSTPRPFFSQKPPSFAPARTLIE